VADGHVPESTQSLAHLLIAIGEATRRHDREKQVLGVWSVDAATRVQEGCDGPPGDERCVRGDDKHWPRAGEAPKSTHDTLQQRIAARRKGIEPVRGVFGQKRTQVWFRSHNAHSPYVRDRLQGVKCVQEQRFAPQREDGFVPGCVSLKERDVIDPSGQDDGIHGVNRQVHGMERGLPFVIWKEYHDHWEAVK